MARTPLLSMLLNLSREQAAASRSERIGAKPIIPAIGRRAVLRGAAGIALASALPLSPRPALEAMNAPFEKEAVPGRAA